jgi:hypothetical protein
MVPNDAPLWFPDRRGGERRRTRARRSGVDRRVESGPGPAEWRRGERRVLPDRRSGIERRRHITAE